jgi:DNA-binding CsgD family transcriptional regulator/tetratricopeptide (TPR) repeat protein
VTEVLARRTFVGRTAELARLGELLARAAAGSGSTVVVGGEAGIGKSRLVARFTELAAPTARSVEGACVDAGDEGLPYGPFTEILHDLVRETGPERLPALLGPGRAELARLMPDLAPRAADVPAPVGQDAAAQARLFELILGVFERLTRERPLVIVVEDLQWADRSTRRLIQFLGRALRDERALLVLTTRTDDERADRESLEFLAELEREEYVERIDLHSFGRDEIGDQLAALLGEAPLASTIEQILARSDGNPFFVEELVLAGNVSDPGLPAVLRDVLSARFAGLSPAARDVLRAAAVAGREIDDELLAAGLGSSVPALASALREAVEHGILVRSATAAGPEHGFRHALLREAALAEVFPGERVTLHAAFAAALEARRAAGDPSVAAASIARHWDAAHQPARALPATVEAAQAAERAFSFPEALGLWRRAGRLVEAMPTVAEPTGLGLDDVLERAAECAVLSGEYREAIELGRAAVAGVDATLEPERAAELNNRLRWYLWEAGDRRGAADAVAEALRLLPADVPSQARARVLAQQAGILLYAGQHETSAAAAREALAITDLLVEGPVGGDESRSTLGDRALALGVLGWDEAILGDVESGLERIREGARIAEALGSPEGMALAATNLAALLDRVGRSAESLDAAQAGYDLTERLGVARTYGSLLCGYIAKAELALGRWDDADRSTSTGLRRASTDRPELWLGVNRARLLIGRGHDAEASVLLGRSRAIDDRLGGTEFRTAVLAAEAELAAWRGRPDDAWAVGREGLALAGDGPPDPSLAWLASLVVRAQADAIGHLQPRRPSSERATLEGRIALVDAAVDAALKARGDLVHSGRGRALIGLYQAERSRAAGADDPARWADVAGRWEGLGRPYQVGYARWREAEAILAGGGFRELAATRLGDAHAIATRLGATPLRAAVETLAHLARLHLDGAPSAGGALGAGPAGHRFTPREAEVLQLVAGGWTNQQIADALFITRKTASVHVSSLLAKLGVSNRGEAAALAHRLGLVADIPPPAGPVA